jgi:hypothetical protein
VTLWLGNIRKTDQMFSGFLSTINSVGEKVGSWTKRNRNKILVAAVLGGSAYVAYRLLRPAPIQINNNDENDRKNNPRLRFESFG